ncbi:MAG TPA: hypothetical protein DCS43_02120 [Verrucomicrobia bacterium]|nr:hypothetical protein [Verrucomicrobiota bacterium]
MDVLKLTILAFIAGGIVLFMADVSIINAILISAAVCTVITTIAVIRYQVDPPKPKPDEKVKGPTIK